MEDEVTNDDVTSEASAGRVDVQIEQPQSRRVAVELSPFLKVFYNSEPAQITIDSGATGNFINSNLAKRLKLTVKRNTQSANQADGISHIKVIGETSCIFEHDGFQLPMDALVTESLDVDILGGTPFQSANDIYARPSRKEVWIGDKKYNYAHNKSDGLNCFRANIVPLKSDLNCTVWPNEFVELKLPSSCTDNDYAVIPRSVSILNKSLSVPDMFPVPVITESIDGKIRLKNDSDNPVFISKHDPFCHIIPADFNSLSNVLSTNVPSNLVCNRSSNKDIDFYSLVNLDPDNFLSPNHKQLFTDILCKFNNVFEPVSVGYNGKFGPLKGTVNMGPTLPPQRKGKLPLYNDKNLDILQNKFDELESAGIFAKPEDIGVVAEYVNPSFLISHPRGGHHLVTAFADVRRYAKPQPSLMPDVDSTIRRIGQFKFLICSDMSQAFFQIPLDKRSMKFCGVSTPFKGTCVYTRCAMGMPGSETALEELMCRVLGDLCHEGFVAIIT